MVFKNTFDGQLPRGSRHHPLCAGWRHRGRAFFNATISSWLP